MCDCTRLLVSLPMFWLSSVGHKGKKQARAGQDGTTGDSIYLPIYCYKIGDIVLEAGNGSRVWIGLSKYTVKLSYLGVFTHTSSYPSTDPINRWHIISFTVKHYVTDLQIDKQLSNSNLFVMDGHKNTTSLSNRMSHVVGRFRSICLSMWLEK